MLPAPARMRRRQDFELAIRRGKRAGGALLTVHVLIPDAPRRTGGPHLPVAVGDAAPAKVGFVIGRAVGGAVTRNRVRRRLRDVARMRVGRLPAGSLLVIRANPRAADARQRDLAAELDLVLDRLVRRQVRASHRP